MATDPSGLNPNQTGARDGDEMLEIVRELELIYYRNNGRYPTVAEALVLLLDRQALPVDYGSNHYYVYSRADKRWLDMRHAAEACKWAVRGVPKGINRDGGKFVEYAQYAGRSASRHGVEDLYSNEVGYDQMYKIINRLKPSYWAPASKQHPLLLSDVLAELFKELDVGKKTDAPYFLNLPASEAQWEKWRNETCTYSWFRFLDTPVYYDRMIERDGAMVMPFSTPIHPAITPQSSGAGSQTKK